MSQQKRSHDWLSQAQNDIKWGESSFSQGFYAQTCFISQQAAEKALKAYAYLLGYDLVKSRSVRLIAQKLNINDEIEEAAKVLDQYYITARYPDSLPYGAPFESFTKRQAEEALSFAKRIVGFSEDAFSKTAAKE